MFEWIETYTLLCLPNQDIGDMHQVYQGHREGLLLYTSDISEPQGRFTPPYIGYTRATGKVYSSIHRVYQSHREGLLLQST
jgi:hypothetical protein